MIWKRIATALTFVAFLFVGAHAADLGNGTVFSQTDASNNSGTVPTWAEGMAPSQVNDSARALQGAVKRDWVHRNPTLASTGSAPAYVLTYTVAPAALYNGQRYSFEANFSNTATATTLNINSLGAKSIKLHSGGNLYDLPPNTIYTNDHVDVIYDLSSDVFILQSPPSRREFIVTKTAAETVNNSTTLQDDDHLFFAVAANTDYEFEFSLFMDTPTAAAIKLTLTGPASPTLLNVLAEDVVDSTQTVSIKNAFSFSHTVSPATLSRAYARYTGLLRNGANAGTVQLQWAQNVATASDTSVRIGSKVRYSIIP